PPSPRTDTLSLHDALPICKMKAVFIAAVAAIGIGQLWLLLAHHSLWSIGAGLLVFFAAFNLLEASLPSLISKAAPADSKGTAMGDRKSTRLNSSHVSISYA